MIYPSTYNEMFAWVGIKKLRSFFEPSDSPKNVLLPLKLLKTVSLALVLLLSSFKATFSQSPLYAPAIVCAAVCPLL